MRGAEKCGADARSRKVRHGMRGAEKRGAGCAELKSAARSAEPKSAARMRGAEKCGMGCAVPKSAARMRGVEERGADARSASLENSKLRRKFRKERSYYETVCKA